MSFAGLLGETPCHHLLFRGEELDFQVWIERGSRPLPRKLVITSKWLTGAPQYQSAITEWNVNPDLDDARFSFVVPDDASQIDFRPVESEQ